MPGCAGLSEGQSAGLGRTWATLVTTLRIPGFATCSTIVLYAGCVYLTTALASVAPLADTSAAREGSVSWQNARDVDCGIKSTVSLWECDEPC